MVQQDESALALAAVYAQALFDLARQRNQEERIAEELAELAGCARRDPGFDDFLSSDAIDDQRRADSLERMFRGKLSDTLLDALLVMNGRGRLSLLGVLAEQFEHLGHEARKQMEVTVTSAVPLGKKERATLVEELGAMTGRETVLTEQVDESIIGGLIVQIGDRRWDDSLATKVARLRKSLLHRASAEIHSGKEYFVSAPGRSG